jgi:hypothetical protein
MGAIFGNDIVVHGWIILKRIYKREWEDMD